MVAKELYKVIDYIKIDELYKVLECYRYYCILLLFKSSTTVYFVLIDFFRLIQDISLTTVFSTHLTRSRSRSDL